MGLNASARPPGNTGRTRTRGSESWREHALCATVEDKSIFHPDLRDAVHTIAAAKRVCLECPVRVQCLEYALANRETEGIWGATTPEQREDLRRLRASS